MQIKIHVQKERRGGETQTNSLIMRIQSKVKANSLTDLILMTLFFSTLRISYISHCIMIILVLNVRTSFLQYFFFADFGLFHTQFICIK